MGRRRRPGARRESPLAECARMIRENPKLRSMRAYVQHGDTSCLLHSVAVTYWACRLSELLPLSVSREALIRGAMLHDYFLYDWHHASPSHRLHGFTHPRAALENARRDYALSEVERDIILRHMFPLTLIPPRRLESVLVSLADKGCSLYETFRRGAYRSLSKRLSDHMNFRMG